MKVGDVVKSKWDVAVSNINGPNDRLGRIESPANDGNWYVKWEPFGATIYEAERSLVVAPIEPTGKNST